MGSVLRNLACHFPPLPAFPGAHTALPAPAQTKKRRCETQASVCCYAGAKHCSEMKWTPNADTDLSANRRRGVRIRIRRCTNPEPETSMCCEQASPQSSMASLVPDNAEGAVSQAFDGVGFESGRSGGGPMTFPNAMMQRSYPQPEVFPPHQLPSRRSARVGFGKSQTLQPQSLRILHSSPLSCPALSHTSLLPSLPRNDSARARFPCIRNRNPMNHLTQNTSTVYPKTPWPRSP